MVRTVTLSPSLRIPSAAMRAASYCCGSWAWGHVTRTSSRTWRPACACAGVTGAPATKPIEARIGTKVMSAPRARNARPCTTRRIPGGGGRVLAAYCEVGWCCDRRVPGVCGAADGRGDPDAVRGHRDRVFYDPDLTGGPGPAGGRMGG